jgi:hypothetical protein
MVLQELSARYEIVGAGEKGWWDAKTECARGFQVNDQFVPFKICTVRAAATAENAIDVAAQSLIQ